MRDRAFKECGFAGKYLAYSEALRRIRGDRGGEGLSISDFPWSHMLNEVVGRALGATVADTEGADGIRVREDFDFRSIT